VRKCYKSNKVQRGHPTLWTLAWAMGMTRMINKFKRWLAAGGLLQAGFVDGGEAKSTARKRETGWNLGDGQELIDRAASD
jgi:hypothetical protein